MYKAAVVIDNASTHEFRLLLNKFPYLKNAVMTEKDLSTLEHFGKFPTLKEFHHSLVEISKFCVKNKIKGMILARDYDYSDDEYIWQSYVDIKHFRKMDSFTAIVNRNRNVNKLIKYLNTEPYFIDLFGGKLEAAYPTYFSSEISESFKEKAVDVVFSDENGRLSIDFHYHSIGVCYDLKTSGKNSNIRIERTLQLKSFLKIKDYKTLKSTVMKMLQIVQNCYFPPL